MQSQEGNFSGRVIRTKPALYGRELVSRQWERERRKVEADSKPLLRVQSQQSAVEVATEHRH